MRLSTLLSITASIMLLGSAAQASDYLNPTNDSRSLSVPDNRFGGASLGGGSQHLGSTATLGGGASFGGGSVATIGSGGGAGVAPKPAAPKTPPVAVMPSAPKPVIAQPAKPLMPVQRELTTGHYDAVSRPSIQPVKPMATTLPTQDRVAPAPVRTTPAAVANPANERAAYERATEARAAYANAYESGASTATLNQLHGELKETTRAYEEVRTGGGTPQLNVTSESLLAKHQNSLKPMAPAAAKATLKARTAAAKAERKARFDAWERKQIQKERQAVSLFRGN